jgi:hypothetical protein
MCGCGLLGVWVWLDFVRGFDEWAQLPRHRVWYEKEGFQHLDKVRYTVPLANHAIRHAQSLPLRPSLSFASTV